MNTRYVVCTMHDKYVFVAVPSKYLLNKLRNFYLYRLLSAFKKIGRENLSRACVPEAFELFIYNKSCQKLITFGLYD